MALSTHGNIDLTSYVAIGDSVTAGYIDGALSYFGQQHAFPNLLANQFKSIGGSKFSQPLMVKNSIGVGFAGNASLILNPVAKHDGSVSFNLTYKESQGDLAAFSINKYDTEGPYHNIGIPGCKIISVVLENYGNPKNGEGNYNPFFTRMASKPTGTSILSDALLLNPTFFSVYLGNNDVLAYALSGGTLDAITPLTGKPSIGFEESLTLLIDSLLNVGAKGVIANLPDLNSIPYFAAIPFDGLLLNDNECQRLNDLYGKHKLKFKKGNNPFVYFNSDESEIKQLQKGESVLFDIIFEKNKEDYLRGTIPLPKKYILTLSEKLKIQKTIIDYNKFIKSISIKKNLAFVDVNGLLKKARTERVYNRSTLDFRFKNGGVFSLDALHPNVFGQSLLANEFITSINTTYKVNIPLLDHDNFKSIIFP
ncbi:MAG: SGNH/GDSL hydrolase family protein [Bacteroidota bacterium]